MYGGLLRMKSKTSPAGSGAYRSPFRKRTRSATPWRAALRPATVSVGVLGSMAVTWAVLWYFATATARQPDPVPTSSTAGAAIPFASRKHSSTTVSVSGRGISTSRLTSNSSEKNSLRPTR